MAQQTHPQTQQNQKQQNNQKPQFGGKDTGAARGSIEHEKHQGLQKSGQERDEKAETDMEEEEEDAKSSVTFNQMDQKKGKDDQSADGNMGGQRNPEHAPDARQNQRQPSSQNDRQR